MYEQNITTPVEEEDLLLPDGWGEGDDIFNEGSWTGAEQVDAPAQDTEEQTEDFTEEQTDAPTPEQTEVPGEAAAPEEAPTTEPTQAQPNRLKFKARVDREDLDVEVDESELPTLYQKAQATDRYRAKLDKQNPQVEELQRMAHSMGYDDPMVFLSSMKEEWKKNEVRRLVDEGVHEEVARDMADRKFAPKQDAAPVAPAEEKPTRDFAAEISMLKAARPDLMGKQLPAEVIKACTDEKNPKHLMLAYAEYEMAQQKAEAEKLRKENEVLKQNAASAARAPVSGTSCGGAVDPEPEDDFLKGFNS